MRIGQAEPATYICRVCGFVMSEAGECPRCKMAVEGQIAGGAEGGDILDQVREMLDAADDDLAPAEVTDPRKRKRSEWQSSSRCYPTIGGLAG
jgi:hypothetical protein